MAGDGHAGTWVVVYVGVREGMRSVREVPHAVSEHCAVLNQSSSGSADKLR